MRTQAVAFVVATSVIICCVLGLRAHADNSSTARPDDALIGEWWTDAREGRVLFHRARDGSYRGTTTCCVPLKPDPDHPAKDSHNPKPELRERSTVGILILWDLRLEDGKYTGGKLYNPRDGKTYRAKIELTDHNTLEFRGYAGIPLFGLSQTWKRATAAEVLDHRPR